MMMCFSQIVPSRPKPTPDARAGRPLRAFFDRIDRVHNPVPNIPSH